MQQTEDTAGAASSRAAAHPPVIDEPATMTTAPEEHIHLPPPTIWPVTTALGVALAGFGLVSTYAFSFLGLAILVFGLFSWVQELRHEHS